jgi:signal transduction histidine kinase
MVAILGLQGLSFLEDRNRAIATIRVQSEAAATAAAIGVSSGLDVGAALKGDPAARTKIADVLIRAQTVSSSIVQTALVVARGSAEAQTGNTRAGGMADVVSFVGEETPLLPAIGVDLDSLPVPEPLRLSASQKLDNYIAAVAVVDSGTASRAYVVVIASLEGTTTARGGLAILLATAAAATLLFLVAVSRGFTRRLEKLAEAARHLGEGDLAYRVEVGGHDEIADVGEAFNKMAEAIQSNRAALAEAVAELAQATADLEKQAEENRRILDRTVGAVDEERRRLATELHDSTIQVLQSAAMQAEYLEMLISRGKSQEAAELLRELTQRLRDATDELRRVLFDLRPPALDRGGLLPSLENRLREAEEAAGFSTSLEVEDGLRVPEEQEAVVYRFCQEAVANAVKHSSAQNLRVRIWKSGETLRAEVKDDGRGFSPGADGPPGHFGLEGMRDRAMLAGGRVEIQSAPGQGTRVELILPLTEPDEGDS